MSTAWSDRDTYDDTPTYDDTATPQARRGAQALACLDRGARPYALITDVYVYLTAQCPDTVPSGDTEMAAAYVLGHDDNAFDDRGRVLGLLACGFSGLIVGILIGLLLAGQVVSSGVLR